MNGLLHRVAARAAGTALALRSDAGLAYAGGGPGPEDVGEAKSRFPTGAEPLAQMPSASAAHKRGRAARPADLLVAADFARTASPFFAEVNDAGALRDTPQIAPNATFTPRVHSTQPLAIDEPQLTMPPLHAALTVPRTARSATAPEPAAAHAPREIAISARTEARADEPAPLMPREPTTPLAPVPQPANRRGALPHDSAATPTEADTEVHIHIGRIDVTAVHEPAPPRRRVPAAPAPISLDGYLAQRGRS